MTTSTKAIIASLSLLFSSFTCAMDLVEHQPNDAQQNKITEFAVTFQAPQSLKKHNPLLFHDDGEFHLIQEGSLSRIPSENVKGFKSELTQEQLKGFLQNGGYLRLSKNDEDDIFLEAKVRGEGGGYMLGLGAKWTTRAIGYGSLSFLLLTGHFEVIGEASHIISLTESAANVAFVIGLSIPGTP